MSTKETDRELLELAARAHGGLIYEPGYGWMQTGREGGSAGMWRPLDDDGDALRLAVKLRLCINHSHPVDQQRWVAVDRAGCEGCYAPVGCVEDDFEDESQRNASTRRAIVRAAAKIGRTVQ